MTGSEVLRVVLVCVFSGVFMAGVCRGEALVEVQFRDREYISYDLRSQRIAVEENNINVRFKTIHSSGLLMYGSGTQGDYVLLELVEGRIRYTSDLGSTQDMSGKHSLIIGDQLADNRWHHVRVNRRGNKVTVKLDGKQTKTVVAPGSFVRLDLDNFLFVGGVDKSTSLDMHGAESIPNFVGCLNEMKFMAINMLYGAKFEIVHYSTSGNLGYVCEEVDYTPVGFPTEKSYLKLVEHNPTKFSLSFMFRTYVANSVLAYKLTNSGQIYFTLDSGSLVLEARILSKNPITIQAGDGLADGEWHFVKASVDTREMSLMVDSRPTVRHDNPWLNNLGQYRSRTFIGGGTAGTNKAGFAGCMYNIRLSGRIVSPSRLTEKQLAGAVVGACNITNHCFPNPCKNGAVCEQTWNRFICDCSGTMYEGDRCQIPMYKATCAEYKALGLMEDSYCQIDPDGVGPVDHYPVLCNMTLSNDGATVIQHTMQKKTRIPDGGDFIAGYIYYRIAYRESLESIKALVDKSVSCQQHVRYDCFGAKLLSSPMGPPEVQWISSKGVMQSYWGGASPGSNKCACGMTNTCADKSKYCNCDVGDEVWRNDEGYLTDQGTLPVTVLRFSEDSEESFITLGPLECFGSKEKTSSQVTKVNFISSACTPVNAPPTTQPPTIIYNPRTQNPRRKHRERRPKTTTTPPTTKPPVTTVPLTFPLTTVRTELSTVAGIHTTKRVPPTRKVTISEDKSTTEVDMQSTAGEIAIVQVSDSDGSTLPTHDIDVNWKNNPPTSPPISRQNPSLVEQGIESKTNAPPSIHDLPTRDMTISLDKVDPALSTARKKDGLTSDSVMVIIIVSVILVVTLALIFLLLVLKQRCECGKKQPQVPRVEVFRHSVRVESPDRFTLDDIKNAATTVELGAYNVKNGTMYQNGGIKKFITFSPISQSDV